MNIESYQDDVFVIITTFVSSCDEVCDDSSCYYIFFESVDHIEIIPLNKSYNDVRNYITINNSIKFIQLRMVLLTARWSRS